MLYDPKTIAHNLSSVDKNTYHKTFPIIEQFFTFINSEYDDVSDKQSSAIQTAMNLNIHRHILKLYIKIIDKTLTDNPNLHLGVLHTIKAYLVSEISIVTEQFEQSMQSLTSDEQTEVLRNQVKDLLVSKKSTNDKYPPHYFQHLKYEQTLDKTNHYKTRIPGINVYIDHKTKTANVEPNDALMAYMTLKAIRNSPQIFRHQQDEILSIMTRWKTALGMRLVLMCESYEYDKAYKELQAYFYEVINEVEESMCLK